MESREPITAELRRECVSSVQRVEVPVLSGEPVIETTLVIDGKVFDSLCDAIDAVHAGLERENAELRERLAVLDESADSMHDGGSITDELREWVRDGKGSLLAIADRIDAEHESACAEAYGNGVMSVPIALDESAWVELPKDADGVPIHVGDVLTDGEYTFRVDELAAFGDGSWSIRNEDGNAWAACDVTHHHAPTVEDVLREFAHVGIRIAAKHGIDAGEIDFYADEEAIAEFAARLRLAEGEEQ